MWKRNSYVERNISPRILYSTFVKLSNHSFTKYTKLGSLYVLISGDSEYVTYIFTSFYQDGACRRPHPLVYKDSSIWVSLRTVYYVTYWCPVVCELIRRAQLQSVKSWPRIFIVLNTSLCGSVLYNNMNLHHWLIEAEWRIYASVN